MNIFKSKKRRMADLKRRTERMSRIMTEAGALALDRDPSLGLLLTSAELKTELDALAHLSLDQAEKFIELLESGVPPEFQHIR